LGRRNLYNHIEEDTLREPDNTIFKILAGESFTKYKDSYYDIDGRQRHNVVSNLMHLLKWQDYNHFEQDIREMLK